MAARLLLGLVGVAAAAGVAISSFGTWIDTSLGGFSGSTSVGIVLAFAALTGAALHAVAAIGGSRWPLLWGALTGGLAALVGVLVTIGVQLANRSTWLVSQFVENRSGVTQIGDAAHVSRGWGATGLLFCGSLLFAVSLVRLALPGRLVESGPRRSALRNAVRTQLTLSDRPTVATPSATSAVDDLL